MAVKVENILRSTSNQAIPRISLSNIIPQPETTPLVKLYDVFPNESEGEFSLTSYTASSFTTPISSTDVEFAKSNKNHGVENQKRLFYLYRRKMLLKTISEVRNRSEKFLSTQ
ncbi:unnamed protein product [Orchesella dallaii]|uniref:Uncharacterized protein n=1 Tax=Orchesella dallaii TaxID=48710 RepID=A0ABP1Q339_9HEXA